jgi:hypothetical protein
MAGLRIEREPDAASSWIYIEDTSGFAPGSCQPGDKPIRPSSHRVTRQRKMEEDAATLSSEGRT